MTEPVQLALISTIGTIVVGIIGLINLGLTKSNSQAISKVSDKANANHLVIKDTNAAMTTIRDTINGKMDLLLKTTSEKSELQGRENLVKEQALISSAIADADRDRKPTPVNIINDETPVNVSVIDDIPAKAPASKEEKL